MLTTAIVIFMAVLLAIGTPVGLAMAAAGAAGLYAMGGTGMVLGILETSPFSAASSSLPRIQRPIPPSRQTKPISSPSVSSKAPKGSASWLSTCLAHVPTMPA